MPAPSHKTSAMIGRTYGRLKVLARDGLLVVCLCSCGTVCRSSPHNIRAGRTRSCGCLCRERHAREGHRPVFLPMQADWSLSSAALARQHQVSHQYVSWLRVQLEAAGRIRRNRKAHRNTRPHPAVPSP